MGLTGDELEGATPPVATQALDQFVPDASLLEMQRRMASMFEQQKQMGGVIDVEAERRKYLLSEVRK